jgi:hypothetical protein
MTQSDMYRTNAEDALRQASKAAGPNGQAAWLKLAREWLMLSRDAEMVDRQFVTLPPVVDHPDRTVVIVEARAP